MNYDGIYIFILLAILYGMFYTYKKNKNTNYIEKDLTCSSCGTTIDTVEKTEKGYEYKCKKCGQKGIFDKNIFEEDTKKGNAEEN